MTEILAITILLFASWFVPKGGDRSRTIHRYLVTIMLIGAILMAIRQDYWPLALWSLICVNALRKPWPAMHITKLASLAVLYGLYAVLQPLIQPEQVALGLILIVVCAVVGALLAIFKPEHMPHYNHSDMLMVMGLASALALTMLQDSLLWALTIPLFVVGVLQREYAVGEAHGWMLCTVMVYAGLYSSPYVMLVSLVIIGAVATYGMTTVYQLHDGPDHGRVRIWHILLRGFYWQGTWKEQLLGFGWNSWAACAERVTQIDAKQGHPDPQHFTHPHNEYIHCLFEHGFVGLLILVAWIGSILHQTWLTNPPLLIPAVTLCAIACTSYPWTLPTEYPRANKGQVEYLPFGSMGMVTLTLVLLLLIGRTP